MNFIVQWIACFYLVSCLVSSLGAQNKPLSQPIVQVLNNYVSYANETSHALYILAEDLELLNAQFYAYIEEQKPLTGYKPENIWTNEEYFAQSPREHYEEMLRLNIYLPAETRGKPLQLAGQMENISQELEQIRMQLARYIEEQDYKKDKKLEEAFALLRRAELLFDDMYSSVEQLRWALQSIYNSFIFEPFSPPHAKFLLYWQEQLNEARTIGRELRQKDPKRKYASSGRKIEEAYQNLKKQKPELLLRVEPIDSSAFCYHKRQAKYLEKYRNYSQYIKGLSRGETPVPQGALYDSSYYIYHNACLLYLNRYGEGLVDLYNKVLLQTGEFCVLEFELSPLFRVYYPKDPAFDAFQKQKNIEPPMQRPDSLEKQQVPSLEGFAYNHIVFLLDVSTSMDKPERLPLLRKSLRKLVELMRAEDNISIIVYSGDAQVLLPPTSASNTELILKALEAINTSVKTDANKGLNMAYKLARTHFIRGGNNRIILASDGIFELSKKSLRSIAKNQKRRNIALSTFYFSEQEFTNARSFLEYLAELGGGSYSYIRPKNIEQQLLRELQAIRLGSN